MDDHGEKIGVGRDPVPLFLEQPGLFPQGPGHGIEGLGQFPQFIPAGYRDIPGQLLQGGFPGALGQVGDLAAHAGGEPEAEEPADAGGRAPHPEDDQLQGQERGSQLPAVDPHHDQAFPGFISLLPGGGR